MDRRKVKNPLRRRVARELSGDWRKYLIISLFLVLTIGFVSGVFVANESMMSSAEAGRTELKLEDGHFILEKAADSALISAISSGEKADIKAYYTEKAKKEFEERFDDEFEAEFKKEFNYRFSSEFDAAFRAQVKSALISQGLDEASASAMLPSAIEQAKENGDYRAAYSSAYGSAYRSAYNEAYPRAYEEAWQEVLAEIDEEYSKAAEKYELNDSDFRPVPVTVYKNFYRNEDEDADSDGNADSRVRVYARSDDINLASVLDGRLPEKENEIAVDRMHADNVGIKVGDKITVGGRKWDVVGLIAYVNYSTLHEKNTDIMFDAISFDVAMVTDDGFAALSQPVNYSYAWQFTDRPADEKQEKAMSDDFLKALLTQAVAAENEISDYLPAYANQAIHFATDDMGSDKAMFSALLNILIIIIAFIFAVTISNTITKESKTIGTLRASGYTSRELICHYLAMPVIVTLISAVIGNILGYSVFKNIVVSMYYGSYSLPAYKTVWNAGAFVKTTLIPIALMFIVNLSVLSLKLRHTPLEFLRCDLKKGGRKRAVRLPEWKFFRRFRMRIIIQNIPTYLILFFGVAFVSVLLAMAIGLPKTLDYYKENAGGMMFANYQYILTSSSDEDGGRIVTENEDAEPFAMESLQRKGENFNEDISVYGISDGSGYVQIDGLGALGEGEVYISDSFAEKYGIAAGDTITLDAKYENTEYKFKVAGLYAKSLNIAVFMPIEHFRSVFGLEEDEFTGYMSDTPIIDIDEEYIASVITEREITKMVTQLNRSMGSYMQYMQVLCVLLSTGLIYLLTKLIIEKNENAISITKILGYENGEIASLYLLAGAAVFIVIDAAAVFIGPFVMTEVWKAMMQGFSGWFKFTMGLRECTKIFVFILGAYIIVLALDFMRIKKIPKDEALKNIE